MNAFTITYIAILALLIIFIGLNIANLIVDWFDDCDWQFWTLLCATLVLFLAFFSFQWMAIKGKDVVIFRSDKYDTEAMVSDLIADGITVERARADYQPLSREYEGSYLKSRESYFTGKVTWTYCVALEDNYSQYRLE